MSEFDKLGLFYLGKIVDTAKKKRGKEEVLLYDSKNFTTHAVCVGMTGSGKTGLGITIIEEAGLDKIPSIVIDPKGDLTNLLLTFPHLSAEEFLPWVDEAEAERNGMKLKDYAKSVAETWKEGLKSWGEDAARVRKLKDAVDMQIYTPASKAGRQLSILSSFAAPSKELILDTGAMRDRVLSTTSGLLGLVGINADPIKSREHILISTIISKAWNKGTDLDIASIIQQVQKPPFEKIGTLDIDTFFPPKDRMALSITLNNLLASPGFQAWMEGEPLDIQSLLYTGEGKPKIAVLSIAHLSDVERMFFVTLFLNEFISWMRRQPGTSSLRALLYMDEIFGYFPPTAMPPSKTPMLTLLKQARAYGVGIVLCTQNPVDLDYKGLSNCGTWFIGKLQTERDKARVIEGLKAASNGEIDSKEIDKLMGSIGKRIFIMRSVYEKNPIVFQTRWTLSYLRGPLTLSQIASLTVKSEEPEAVETPKTNEQFSENKPSLPLGISEYFVSRVGIHQPVHYKPYVVGLGKLHFVDAKNKVDVWEDVCLLAPVDEDGKSVRWDDANPLPEGRRYLDKDPLPNSVFDQLPVGLFQEKNYTEFQKALVNYLYQNQVYTIYQMSDPKLTSKEGESENDFRLRVSLTMREKRDEKVKKLRDKYAGKINTLSEKLRRAQEKVSDRQQKAGWRKIETWISFGATILGAVFGRKITKGTITSAGTSMKQAGRIGKDSQATMAAEDEVKMYQQQMEELQAQVQSEVDAINADIDPTHLSLDSFTVRPRKGDIDIEKVSLAWWPLS